MNIELINEHGLGQYSFRLPAEQRLATFIETLCQQLSDDFVFRQLFLREVIEQNAERAQFLAEQVMAAPCHALHDVFLAINPNCDPHFLTTSLMGLTLFHFQINPLRPLLPGGSVEKQQGTSKNPLRGVFSVPKFILPLVEGIKSKGYMQSSCIPSPSPPSR